MGYDMDDEIQRLMDTLGIPPGTQEKSVKSSDEQWDVYRLTQEVAKLCAEHSKDCACIFAATPIDDEEGDGPEHVACMVGGAHPVHRAFGDMLMAVGGKLFNSNFNQKSAGQMVVLRERDEDDDA